MQSRFDVAAERITGDASIDRLAELFAGHPAWRAAAERIEEGATSNVFFSQRPGEAWHLERSGGLTRLLPGAAADPDFAFRFTPSSIDLLARVNGGIGSFAVALFERIVDPDPGTAVGFRVVAPFSRLVRRGYLSLLAAGGLRVLAFGAARGVRTIGDLRRLVERLGSEGPRDWERAAPAQGAP